MPILEVSELSVSYGSALILDRVSLDVEFSQCVAVLGPNGAGKTTLLRAISRMVPSRGSIRYDGKEITPVNPHRLPGMGVVHCPENRRLFPEFTVMENLEMGAFTRRDKGAIEEDLERCFRIFPALAKRKGQFAGTMSGGEQQMLAIARAMMGKPRLLLLDEPSIGLAQVVKEQIFQAVREIKALGVTLLLVEQDTTMALEIADRAYILEQGRIAAAGAPEELFRDTRIRDLYLGVG